MEIQKNNEKVFTYSIALGSMEEPVYQEKFRDKKHELSDETILKELRLNDQPITILDISSLIMVVEEKDSNPYGVFKCYFNNATKEFYIAINELTPIKVFTRSILLNMFDFAEKQGAKTVYACLRKSAIEIAQYAQSFLFVGFEYVNEENEEENSNDTHIILKINIAKDGEKKHLPDSDDDLFG